MSATPRVQVNKLTGDLRLASQGPPLDGAVSLTAAYEVDSDDDSSIRSGSNRAIVALAWWRGEKAEFWIDVQKSPPVTSSSDFQYWCAAFSEKGRRGGVNVANSHPRGGWTEEIVEAVESIAGGRDAFACMIGHLAGTNERLFRNAKKTCLRFGLEELLSSSIAAGSTAFYQSRWKAGFRVADLADTDSGIWIRMFRDEDALQRLCSSTPLYEGVEWAPEQEEFTRLLTPSD